MPLTDTHEPDVLSGGALVGAPLNSARIAAQRVMERWHVSPIVERECTSAQDGVRFLNSSSNLQDRRYLLVASGDVTVVYEGRLYGPDGGTVGEDAHNLACAISKLDVFSGVPVASVSLRPRSDIGFAIFEAGSQVRAVRWINSGRRWELHAEGRVLPWEVPIDTLDASIVRSYIKRLFGVSFPETIAALEASKPRIALEGRQLTAEERLRRRLASPPPKRVED